MTEAEWIASPDPDALLDALREKGSDRKLRLYGVSCCRRIWHLLTDPRSQQAVECVELVAEGYLPVNSLRMARVYADQAADCSHGGPALVAYDLVYDPPFDAVAVAAKRAAGVRADAEGTNVAADVETAAQLYLLRDIFGNPFRPAALASSWLTSTVVALARGIYEDRAFDRMPILADALQDAGCDNEDVLTHCRGPGPHVRGCWVVDLVLGKE
jgi:hypothetical protein